MKFSTTKQKMDYLLELINNENTGNSDDLCKKNICLASNPVPVFGLPARNGIPDKLLFTTQNLLFD